MRFREWLHPHRQLLLALVAVAVVSAGALGWLLIQQDAVLARQQEADRLQQQAETAAAAVRASLADLPRLAGAPTAASSLRIGVLRVELTTRGVVVRGDTPVLWVPHESGTVETPAAGLGAAETREFSGDLPGALNAYMLITRERPRDATAVARVARVERKLRRSAAALATYDCLEGLSTAVDGLPASLVARVGRASVHADGGDPAALRHEAGALRDDLLAGRWPLSRAQFDFYRAQASTWLGSKRQVTLISRAGSPARTVAAPETLSGPIAVHPDGRQVAFSTGERLDEVWVLEHFLPAAKSAAQSAAK